MEKCKSAENFEKYNIARNDAKLVVSNTRFMLHKILSDKLNTKDREKDIYKIASLREKKNKRCWCG